MCQVCVSFSASDQDRVCGVAYIGVGCVHLLCVPGRVYRFEEDERRNRFRVLFL